MTLLLGTLTLINPVLASIALFVMILASFWLVVPFFFLPYGIFVRRLNAFRSIFSSFRMVRFTFASSALFVFSIFILTTGLNYLWSVRASGSWMTLIGIAGHALAIGIARGTHRVSASVALVVATGLAIFGWERFRTLGASRGVAAALVALGVALAFLGRFTPSAHPFLALGNPLGGLAMVGLAWWLYLAAATPRAGGGAVPLGWALVAASFAAVAAIVVWTPALLAGLLIQVVATVVLAAGVGMLHRGAAS